MAIEIDRVQKPLRQLRKSLKGLSQDPPPDAVHKLRTRARQVEAIAAALPPAGEKLARRLLKSIKSVRKAAGRVRDMDVLAGHARTLPQEPHHDALARLVQHLERSREKHAAGLLVTFERRSGSARKHLKLYARELENSNGSGGIARESEARVQSAALRLTAELRCWPALNPRNLHAFRLKVKELRSTLQLFAGTNTAFVDALGTVKDQIGEWHDWQQLAGTAARVLDTRQDRALIALIRETSRKKQREALATANALRERHLEHSAKKPPASDPRLPAAAVTRRSNPAA